MKERDTTPPARPGAMPQKLRTFRNTLGNILILSTCIAAWGPLAGNKIARARHHSQVPPTTRLPQEARPLVAAKFVSTHKAPSQASKPPTKGPKHKPQLPFPHFDKLIDLHRSGHKIRATLIVFPHTPKGPSLQGARKLSYQNKGSHVDFWPASTIKLYVATATLLLLKQMRVSLDATATFYHQSKGKWVKDTRRSFRAMLYDSITCSTNSDYTLLLRFVGVDWLHQHVLTRAKGFHRTAVMRGYVNKRPFHYKLREPQRIIVREGKRRIERRHSWSGRLYGNKARCQVARRGGYTNCTSTDDMAAHLKRLFFHQQLPKASRFAVRRKDLHWLRYGTSRPVLGAKCNPGGWPGVKRVLPHARYYNKIGLVKRYFLDMAYVDDPTNQVHYILAIATKSHDDAVMVKLSEEIARMVKTPQLFVHLQNLRDHVNPVQARLTVYSRHPGRLTLLTKPFSNTARLPRGHQQHGWKPLPGATTLVAPGVSYHKLRSACLRRGGKRHIIARLESNTGKARVYSDLHYVIIKTSRACR